MDLAVSSRAWLHSPVGAVMSWLFASREPGVANKLAPRPACPAWPTPGASLAGSAMTERTPPRIDTRGSLHRRPSLRAPRVVRVLRVIDPGQPSGSSGRMMMSGRIGDVCAELDRLTSLPNQNGSEHEPRAELGRCKAISIK